MGDTDKKTDTNTPPADGGAGGGSGDEKQSAGDAELMGRVLSHLPGMSGSPAGGGDRQDGEPKNPQAGGGASTPAEQPGAAADPEPGADADPEPGADADPEPDRKGWPDSATKRVNKLSAQKKEQKERADALEARVAELEKQAAGGEAEAGAETPASEAVPEGLHTLDSLEAVEERRAVLEDTRDVLADYKATGWEGEVNGEHKSYTAEQIRERWQAAKEELRQLPKVEKALRERDEKYRPWLEQRFGEWWGKQGDKRFTRARGILENLPELKRMPAAELLVANAVAMDDLIESGKVRVEDGKVVVPQGKPAASGKPAPPAAPAAGPEAGGDPPPVPGTGAGEPGAQFAAPGAEASGGRSLTSEDLQRMRSGNQDALADIVGRMRKAG